MKNDIEALKQQALASYGSGLVDEAVRLWRDVLALDPAEVEIQVYLGSALKELGDIEAAAAHYEAALRREPNMAEVHYNLGNIRQAQGRLADAAACYQRALALNDKFSLAAYNLGNVCRDSGRLQQAIDCYKHAILLDPAHAASYNNLGNALKHQGKLAQAVQCYQAALANAPDFPDALYNLGNALYEQQDFAAALPWFDKAAIRDADARALYCCYKSRQFDTFRQRLQGLLEEKPHHSPQVATLAAHQAINFGGTNDYRFCPDPFTMVYRESIAELTGEDPALRRELLADICSNRIDERQQALLHHGVQSSGNLFYREEASFRRLAELVRVHLAAYRERYREADCELIRAFPGELEFESSWYIRMRRGGHLTSHIHETGWVSGVLYLALPSRAGGSEEGCFELGLHGDDYPIEPGAGDFPAQVLPIEVGDIVLFPANLFHRTIPFAAYEERICVAFDLKPRPATRH